MFDDSRGVFWEITPVDVASESESVGQYYPGTGYSI